MGYGKNLKDALDAKNMSVKELARRAGISPTTLYSVIKRDSAVRFDHALRIAGVLGIDVDLICKNNPYQEETTEVLPEMLPNYLGVTDKLNRKTYIEK
jgi:transcriptional regulator with XRE-family HTH domain